MYKILENRTISHGLQLLRVEAPAVAAKAQAGQFVIVRVDDQGERIPLSIAGWDDESVTFIVQDVGVTTRKLSLCEEGTSIPTLAGPLGRPFTIERNTTVAVVCGCFGIGPALPLARALKEAGNRVITIIEARNKDWLFWTSEHEAASDKLVTTAGDGTYGDCNASNPLGRILSSEPVSQIYAVGCTFMMKEVARIASSYKIRSRASLMPLMVDGTGMCGACRCLVGGKVRFGCVDGPEFDGAEVDWDLLVHRMRSYLDLEVQALDEWDRENWHRALDQRNKKLGDHKILKKS
jgi:ferredoxin--NADP+ reductase